MTAPERGLWIDDPRDREDLATFLDRAMRLDDAAVVRLRERSGTHAAVAWVATGLEVLASRVVTVTSQASALSIVSASASCQRSQTSCTSSSASATEPSIR